MAGSPVLPVVKLQMPSIVRMIAAAGNGEDGYYQAALDLLAIAIINRIVHT